MGDVTQLYKYFDYNASKERTTAMAFADVAFRVRKLNVQDGEVVVISHNEAGFNSAEHLAKGIGKFLQEQGKDNVVVLVNGPELTIETLDEEAMRKCGWVRTVTE